MPSPLDRAVRRDPIRGLLARSAFAATSALTVVTVGALCVLGCHGKESASPVGASHKDPPGPRGLASPLHATKVKSNLIATLGDRAVGPYLARRDTSALAAFLAFDDDGVRRVSVIPLTAQGELTSGVKHLVPTPFDSADLAVSATHGPDSGYAVTFSALTDRGKGLWAFGVTEAGALRGQAAEITRTANDIVWSEMVPTSRGALVLWVEQSPEGEGGLHAAALDPAGKLRGVPLRVLRGVSGWQVIATDTQAQVAIVHAKPGPAEAPAKPEKSDKADKSSDQPKKPAPPTPAISLFTLDADARIERAVAIAQTAKIRGPIEVSRDRGRTHVAWTEASGSEPEVLAVTVDDTSGVLAPPHRVTDTRDGTLLVALASASGGTGTGAVVAWERDVAESRGQRYVQIARLGDGVTPPRRVSRIEVAAKSRVEVSATPEGFAILASVRPCSFDPKPGADCAAQPFVPALLRTDAELAPLDVSALDFGEDRPGMGWALGCAPGCLALSASAESPAHVRTAFVAPRNARSSAPTIVAATATAGREAARFLEVETLATGESMAHLAQVRLADRTLVASLTSDFDVPGRGNRAATLRIRSFDDQGRSLDEAPTRGKDPTVLTNRALAVGGIAMAGAGKPEDGAAIAWVAREGGDPEVHITRLDARGRRTNDIVLTNAKGDATDVALAWVGNAWMVGWVDFRNGNGEVYATKITPDLRRIVREERITNAPGDASGLRLLWNGKDRVFAAWSDPREAARDGFADIYVAPIRVHDATRMAEESRLVPSVPHSRSPELLPMGDGAVVAWIEQAPDGADPSRDGAYRALAMRLDPTGKPTGVPTTIPTAGPGHPTALSLEATAEGLRGVVSRTHGEGVTLDGFVGSFGSLTAFSIGSIATPRTSDVAILTFREWVYFGEDGAATHERRLRRGHVAFAGPVVPGGAAASRPSVPAVPAVPAARESLGSAR